MVQEKVSYLKGPVPAVLLLAAVLASFLASSGPVQWMDNGMFLADATKGQYFAASLGPLDHPLYQFFNTAFYELFGSYALSLLNSILLVPLAAGIFWMVRSLGGSRNLACLGAAVAILSHAMFWVSTKAEVYIFHAMFVVLAFGVYLDRRHLVSDLNRLFLIGVLTGLAASIHQLTFIVLLPLYIQALYEFKFKTLATLPGFALGFFTAYPGMINDLGNGMSLFEIARHYLTGTSSLAADPGWEGSMLRFDTMLHEKNSVVLLCLSLIGPQLLGLALLPKDKRHWMIWWAVVLNFIFAASYNVNDRFTFFLPGIALASVLGVIRLREWLPHNRFGATLMMLSVFSSPLVLLSAWTVYDKGLVKLPVHAEALPYRNDIHYFMVPYLKDTSAQQFVREYESLAPDGALIIADWTPMGALRSAQAAGGLRGRSFEMCEQARDIGIFLKGPGAFLPRTSYCDNIRDKYRLDKTLVGYQLQYK